MLEQPFLISSPDDLERLYQQIAEIDYLEWVRQQRPNSKWVVDLITNVTWFVWKIRDHPIGRGKYLPGYIAENRGIDAVENNAKTGKPCEDNLCFFRCLALYNGCHTKNLERDAQYYYQHYRDAGLSKKKFHGVKISKLDELENFLKSISKSTALPRLRHTVKTKTIKKILPRLLLPCFAALIAIFQARFTWTCTKTTFRILKTWPGTVNPSAVQDVASTGNALVI